MRTALPFSPPNNVGIIKDRENETVKEKNSALRGSKLLILLKSPKSSFIFVETCSVQVKFEDKVTPKYLECPTPLTSDTETDIAISGRNLRSLPISVDLVFYIFSVSLFRFSHKLFSIFYVRVVAEQNSISINSIKRYATEIDNSKLYVIYKNKKK